MPRSRLRKHIQLIEEHKSFQHIINAVEQFLAVVKEEQEISTQWSEYFEDIFNAALTRVSHLRSKE